MIFEDDAMLCLRCKVRETISYNGLSVSDFVAKLNVFQRQHNRCKDPNASKIIEHHRMHPLLGLHPGAVFYGPEERLCAILRHMGGTGASVCLDLAKMKLIAVDNCSKDHDKVRVISVCLNLNAMSISWNDVIDFEEAYRNAHGLLEGWTKPGPKDIDWPRHRYEKKWGRTKDKIITPEEYLEMEKRNRCKS